MQFNTTTHFFPWYLKETCSLAGGSHWNRNHNDVTNTFIFRAINKCFYKYRKRIPKSAKKLMLCIGTGS